MLQNIRPIEIIALLAIIILLFGAKKLPELAKGVGQSLKIFRKEVKDQNGNDSKTKTEATVLATETVIDDQLDTVASAPAPTASSPATAAQTPTPARAESAALAEA